MDHDPRYNVRIPERWVRVAWLSRGLLGGFAAGILFSYFVPSGLRLKWVLPAILATLFFLALTFVPQAWIEQRNRWQASRRQEFD